MTEPSAPILIAFRPEEPAREPVEFGIAAGRLTGAPLVIAAIRHGGAMVDRLSGGVDDSAGGASRTIEHLRLDMERQRVVADIRVMSDKTIAHAIKRAMEELDPQLIVVWAHGSGGLLKGTTASRVIHDATCPVAVVPKGYKRPEGGVEVVGAAYAPTPEGIEAVQAAATLARAGGVRLKAITVLEGGHAEEEPTGILSEQRREAGPEEATAGRRRLDHESGMREVLREYADGLDVEVDTLTEDVADGLVAASRHVDLLVMGSRAQGPRRAVLLGSVSRKVVERSACPVLVIPRGTTEVSRRLLDSVHAKVSV
jgi:nucleotide-binding universal stress UspA family protein